MVSVLDGRLVLWFVVIHFQMETLSLRSDSSIRKCSSHLLPVSILLRNCQDERITVWQLSITSAPESNVFLWSFEGNTQFYRDIYSWLWTQKKVDLCLVLINNHRKTNQQKADSSVSKSFWRGSNQTTELFTCSRFSQTLYSQAGIKMLLHCPVGRPLMERLWHCTFHFRVRKLAIQLVCSPLGLHLRTKDRLERDKSCL